MIPQAYFEKVKQFFCGDTKKTWLWFSTPNPALGMVSPLNLIKVGRGHRVKQFIDNAIDENKGFYP